MKDIQNIMVAVDFHDSVGDILGFAESLAQKYNARIWVVHVIEPNPDFVGSIAGPQYIEDLEEDDLREEHRTLQSICDTFLDKEIEFKALTIEGSTVDTVLEEASKLEADLLVVGTHKHGFLYNLLSESVSLELFRKVNIPLLTIPIDEE